LAERFEMYGCLYQVRFNAYVYVLRFTHSAAKRKT
jgi:hypothetical protein